MSETSFAAGRRDVAERETSGQRTLHPALREYPTKLFVEVSTRCNLNCFMCVKQQNGNGICEGDLTPELFVKLEPAFTGLDALILNGVGEPLLNPHLESFIHRAKELMPASSWVGFQTNGLLLTNLRALSLIEAGVDRICISMDAASPDTFRKIREGSDLSDLEYAFAALAMAKERCGRADVQIGIEFVAMRSNLDELPSALRWAAHHGATFAIVTHALPYDEERVNEVAFSNCSAEAITLFERYRRQASMRGLDICRYFEARWKYSRSEDEQALVSIVNAMKAEADANDLFIDMKKLLQMDMQQMDNVVEIFAEARAVAEEVGLDLQLPEMALSRIRHCSFIEEGGAFITWEGEVSPCYFLWHRYSCFASGWKQQVQAKVFGSLAERTISEIWNNSGFRTFRAQVIEYDYPSCSSCSLAPCDYVQTEDFEQDCHIRNVPCGACLWCMGVFQCLR